MRVAMLITALLAGLSPSLAGPVRSKSRAVLPTSLDKAAGPMIAPDDRKPQTLPAGSRFSGLYVGTFGGIAARRP